MTPEQLGRTTTFVTSILTDLKGLNASNASRVTELTHSIRRKILDFNKPRLDYYLEKLYEALCDCLARSDENSEGPNSDASNSPTEGLELTANR